MKEYTPSISNSPTTVSEAAVLYTLSTKQSSKSTLLDLKTTSRQTDEIIAYWLNISLKSLKNYRKSETELKPNMLEHIFLLKALYNLGRATFGNVETFNLWLAKDNFHLENRSPLNVLNTISGIRFIEDRLIGMAYGDNA